MDLITVHCGSCIGCLIEASRQWAVRCMHEAQMHERNCFITLTYDDEHLPSDWNLNLKHWQLFAKSMRRRVGKFRFLHVGEYGDENHRPHYHAVIFGQDFSEDRKYLVTRKKHRFFRSARLEECWQRGFSEVTDFSYDTAAYVARYVLKKRKENDQAVHLHGPRKKEYATMSRNRGLGSSWMDRYGKDVYPCDFVVVAGRKAPVPRYYDKWLEEHDPELLRELKEEREWRGQQSVENNSYARLGVRETCLRAKIKNLRREL